MLSSIAMHDRCNAFTQMKRKVVAVRVPDDIYQSIQAKGEASGHSLSAIACELLSDALQSDTQPASASDLDWFLANCVNEVVVERGLTNDLTKPSGFLFIQRPNSFVNVNWQSDGDNLFSELGAIRNNGVFENDSLKTFATELIGLSGVRIWHIGPESAIAFSVAYRS